MTHKWKTAANGWCLSKSLFLSTYTWDSSLPWLTWSSCLGAAAGLSQCACCQLTPAPHHPHPHQPPALPPQLLVRILRCIGQDTRWTVFHQHRWSMSHTAKCSLYYINWTLCLHVQQLFFLMADRQTDRLLSKSFPKIKVGQLSLQVSFTLSCLHTEIFFCISLITKFCLVSEFHLSPKHCHWPPAYTAQSLVLALWAGPCCPSLWRDKLILREEPWVNQGSHVSGMVCHTEGLEVGMCCWLSFAPDISMWQGW